MAEAATLLRRLYGPSAAKLLARDLDVSPSATKKWLVEGVPVSRIPRVLAQSYAELDRQMSELAELEAELDRLAAPYRRLLRRERG